ncbi:MAG: hypothetical protein WDZ49_11060 [Litorilinea sp.]
MAILDTALRPAWIFETLRLWQPYTSVPILLEQAMDFTAQELPSSIIRQRALNQILRFYVDHSGRGARRRTLAQNVWAAYVRGYRAHVLAPAFLTHLAAGNEVAQAAGVFFHTHNRPGTEFSSAELRRFLAEQHPARRFSDASVGAWIRTLTHFQVILTGPRLGEYSVRRSLPVAGNIFPLLVYSWAGARPCAWVDPTDFRNDPILAYVDDTGFDHYWQRYAGHLWFPETQGDGDACRQVWRLRDAEPGAMARTLINLLTPYRRPRRYATANTATANTATENTAIENTATKNRATRTHA